jgi:hypothetical protein
LREGNENKKLRKKHGAIWKKKKSERGERKKKFEKETKLIGFESEGKNKQ